MNPVLIASRVEAELALWRATAELAAVLPRGSWTLVGAQMVFLLAYEYDLPIGRTSGDVDLLMNVRTLTDATQEASSTLVRLGYELEPPALDGRAHRFRRADAVVDVLLRTGPGDAFTCSPFRRAPRSPCQADRRHLRAAGRSG